MNKITMDGFVKTHFGEVIEADGQIICGDASINISSILTNSFRRRVVGAKAMPATCLSTGPVCKSRWRMGLLSPVHTYSASGRPELTMKAPSSTSTPTMDISRAMSIGLSGDWTSMWMSNIAN